MEAYISTVCHRGLLISSCTPWCVYCTHSVQFVYLYIYDEPFLLKVTCLFDSIGIRQDPGIWCGCEWLSTTCGISRRRRSGGGLREAFWTGKVHFSCLDGVFVCAVLLADCWRIVEWVDLHSWSWGAFQLCWMCCILWSHLQCCHLIQRVEVVGERNWQWHVLPGCYITAWLFRVWLQWFDLRHEPSI